GRQALMAPRLMLLGAGTVTMTAAGVYYSFTGQARGSLGALLVVGLFLGALALLLLAVLCPVPWLPPTIGARWAFHYRMAALPLAGKLLLAVLATLALSLALSASGDPRLYDSDAAAFNHYNAELALHGRNPYTSDALFWDAI